MSRWTWITGLGLLTAVVGSEPPLIADCSVGGVLLPDSVVERDSKPFCISSISNGPLL